MIAFAASAAPERLLPPSPSRAEDHARPTLVEAEFRRLYAAVAGPLRGYLRRAVGSDAVADDLMQESFYRYLRSGFRGESDLHRRRFLFRVASNLVIDHYRRNRHVETELPEQLAAPRAAAGRALGPDLERLMRSLKLRQRQLLWLAHVEGFSHREIGEMLNVREGSVRPMLFRARRRLAALLRENGMGPEVLR